MGGSAEVLYKVASEQGRALYLYDTFTGIPHKDPIDSHNVGDFSGGLSFSATMKDFPEAIVQDGIFPRMQFIPEEIAFVHLDVDQYRSYRESLDALIPKMVKGGVILCDDYCLDGAKKAIDETEGTKIPLPDGRMMFVFHS